MKPENLKDKIITYEEYKQMLKVNEDEDFTSEQLKVILKCKNCRHRDIMVKFRREKKPSIQDRSFKPWKPLEKAQPTRYWETKTSPTTMRTRTSGVTTARKYPKSNITSLMMGGIRGFEDLFFCPKCDSSMIVIEPSDILKVVSWIV